MTEAINIKSTESNRTQNSLEGTIFNQMLSTK
jgi:hypothetical protein